MFPGTEASRVRPQNIHDYVTPGKSNHIHMAICTASIGWAELVTVTLRKASGDVLVDS